MHTLKKFIKYYGPYKAVFFIDLLCATIISLVDLAYPQILAHDDENTVRTERRSRFCMRYYRSALLLLMHMFVQSAVQILCQHIRDI